MRKIILFLTIFISFFALKENVYAVSNVSLQYYDSTSSYDEIEEIKTNIKNTPRYKEWYRSYEGRGIVIFKISKDLIRQAPEGLENFTDGYALCRNSSMSSSSQDLSLSYPFASSPTSSYFSVGGYCSFYDSNYNLVTDKYSSGASMAWRFYLFLNEKFYNSLIYSDLPFKVIGGDGYIYDIYDNSELLYSFEAGYDIRNIREDTNYLNRGGVKFEVNTIHEISKKILGKLPEQYSFCYTIFDYLIVCLFVFVLISPFVILLKIMRW